MNPIEQTANDFDNKKLLEAQKKTWEFLNVVALKIKPGMSEDDATEFVIEEFKKQGVTQHWHRVYVRFGQNTIKPYGEPSVPNTRLMKNDIFFLDLGPVWDGYEGDAGQSFVVGSNELQQKCVQDSKSLFATVKEKWQVEGLSGMALYEFAQMEAKRLGWQFITRGASGHRISDFPHAHYHRGKLIDVDFKPAPCLWVLEIQIRHPELAFGAFYEDILM